MLNDIMTLKSGLEVTQGHVSWYHSKLGCGFLFAFHSITMALYLASIPRYSVVLVENRDFFILPCIRRPR